MDHGQLSIVTNKFQWMFSEKRLNACDKHVKFCRRQRILTPFRLGLALTEICASQRIEPLPTSTVASMPSLALQNGETRGCRVPLESTHQVFPPFSDEPVLQTVVEGLMWTAVAVATLKRFLAHMIQGLMEVPMLTRKMAMCAMHV